jgi:hypothetical protein
LLLTPANAISFQPVSVAFSEPIALIMVWPTLSPARGLLAWSILALTRVDSVVVCATITSLIETDNAINVVSKIEHLEESLKAADGRLDQATLAVCDEIWKTLRGDRFRYNRQWVIDEDL